MSMNKAIGMSCRNTDIISVMKHECTSSFVHTVQRSPWKDRLEEKLVQSLGTASIAADFPLLPIQMKAVSRIIYRPAATVKFTPPLVLAGAPPATLFETASSDLKAPVVLDMPTGTGKTITTILGCILFAIERKSDMERRPSTGATVSGVHDVTMLRGIDPSAPPVSDKCIFFTPRHLVEHWVAHGAIAKRVVEGMTFPSGAKWTVRVVTNKLASAVDVAPNEVLVIVCDASRCKIAKYLESNVYYSSVCFDEVGERDSKINAMFQHPTAGRYFQYGRAVLCSADFGKWGDCWFNVGSKTLLRTLFPNWTTYSKKTDVVATAVTSAIFDESERGAVMLECTSALDSSIVDWATIEYRPSLLENLGMGYGAALGNDRGCDLFESTYGVCIKECSTVNEIVAAITDVIRSNEEKLMHPHLISYSSVCQLRNQVRKLEDLRVKIHGTVSDDCPICLERMANISIIQPCLHFTCKSCMSKLSGKCPMCRSLFSGTVGISTQDRPPVKKARVASTGQVADVGSSADQPAAARIGDLFFDEMAAVCGPNKPSGVSRAIQTTLGAIQNARNKSSRSKKTLRTMIICPGADMREDLFEDAGFDVFHYKTSGTKSSPVTMKKMRTLMRDFQSDDGKCKLLCVRDAGFQANEDNMTGLDVRLDCVVAIGNGNLAQRLGRLCRLSRISLPDDEKHALYIQIVPSMG